MDTEKLEGQKKAQEKSYVVTQFEDANIKFVDYVYANWKSDIVVLSFVQNNPMNITPIDQPGRELTGRIVSQVAVSWPHLVAIRDLLNQAINENREKAIDAITKALGGGKENE